MKALSILACPKSFEGTASAIQKTALAMWKRIEAQVEIILYGDSPGVAEIAEKYQVRHVPNIETAPSGVPLFSALARHATEYASYDRQIYLNADIILPPDIVDRLHRAPVGPYLITGERIDLSMSAVWDEESGWAEQLNRLRVQGLARPHGPTGMDYFIFPRGLWSDLRPLPLGRGGYDNALLAYCLRKGVPIIDATELLPVIHQWHDYSQLPGGMAAVHSGVEAKALQELHDIKHSPPSVADADWVLSESYLKKIPCRADRLRSIEIDLRYRRNQKKLSYALRLIWRARAFWKRRGATFQNGC